MTMLSLRLVTWLQSWLRIVAKWLVTVKSFSRQVAQKRGPSCCFSNNLNAFFVWGPGSDPTTGWIPPQKLTLRNLKVDGCQDCMVNLRVKWSSHHQIDVTSFLEISTPWVRSELGHRGRHDPLQGFWFLNLLQPCYCRCDRKSCQKKAASLRESRRGNGMRSSAIHGSRLGKIGAHGEMTAGLIISRGSPHGGAWLVWRVSWQVAGAIMSRAFFQNAMRCLYN